MQMTPKASFRIIQVSDTHLARNRAYFQANWESFLALMDEEKPDLVVHTGDLCLAGNAFPEELAFGREQMARLGVPWRIIPGNQDVGEPHPDPRRGHPLSPEKRAGWTRLFGPDWWQADAGQWRIIGINTQIMGSGLEAEEEQWRWLEQIAGAADGLPALLFCHKPPFLGDPNDRTLHDNALHPEPRARLLALIAKAGIGYVACGHNHIHQTAREAGTTYLWAPSTSFVNRMPKPGLKRSAKRITGFMRYTLNGGRLEYECVEPPRFICYDMTAWQRANGSTTKLPLMPLASLGGG